MSPRDDRLPTSNSTLVQWFKLDQFVPERAVTSHFISSKALLCLRIPLVLYSTIALWADIGISLATNEFHHYFAYFTRFTFVGLNAYLIVSSSKTRSSLSGDPLVPTLPFPLHCRPLLLQLLLLPMGIPLPLSFSSLTTPPLF